MITKILLVILIIISLFILLKILKPENYSKEKSIKTFIRQAARWSSAAKQDKNPIIAVLHANYGAGYLWALKDIATDNEIEKIGGIEIFKFRDEIVAIQDKANKELVRKCPGLVPENDYLAKIAGEA